MHLVDMTGALQVVYIQYHRRFGDYTDRTVLLSYVYQPPKNAFDADKMTEPGKTQLGSEH